MAWHFLEDGETEAEGNAFRPLTIGDDKGNDVASVYSADDATVDISRADAIANARLIAAAPEMLEALKAITAAFNVFRLKPEGAPGSAVRAIQDMQISAMDDAHSAIAKAEGGAS
jgi:hypothetical protein